MIFLKHLLEMCHYFSLFQTLYTVQILVEFHTFCMDDMGWKFDDFHCGLAGFMVRAELGFKDQSQ
jgi:hypothetical protein